MGSADDVVAKWIRAISVGDSVAEGKIWETYAHQIERCAKRSLNGAKRREFDEEDVTVAVLNSLFRGLKDGRLKEVETRGQLLALLKEMARRKSAEARRKQFAQRRGAGKVCGESGFGNSESQRDRGIENVPSRDPDPAEALVMAESFTNMLRSLPSATLREIATLKIAKFKNTEIAEHLGITVRTVERKVAEIRKVISQQMAKSRNDE